MEFWIIAAALAIGVGAVLGLTLIKRRQGGAPAAAYDLQVYRDQLREVDRDLARGVIGQEEAERLRAEVSRRILSADAQLEPIEIEDGQPHKAGVIAALIVAGAIAGGGVLVYNKIGAPGYDDLPHAARIAASEAARAARSSQVEAEALQPSETDAVPEGITSEYLGLVEKLREAVKARPEDQQGLRFLVRSEAALGNMVAARKAMERLVALRGTEATAQEHAMLADLMINAAGGYVSIEAETALRRALEIDQREPSARYYLGLYFLQVDRPDSAFRIWEGLLDESMPDAPWVTPIRAQIEEVAALAGVRYTLPPLEGSPAPDRAQIEAVQGMEPDAQAEMIRGMVAGLAERLASEGGTAEEWARLITAYGVLGEAEKARTAYAEARAKFDGQSEKLAILQAAAATAGVAE